MEPFSTQNKKLAEALITAGCTLAGREHSGPTINTYTPNLLRDKGVIKGGVTHQAFEIAVLGAVERKIPGAVSFLFERNAVLDRCIKAFDAIERKIKASRQWEKMDAIQRQEHPEMAPPAMPDISEETVIQVLCLHRDNMRGMEALMFANPAICSVVQAEREGWKDENATATGMPSGKMTGSAKVWSVNLNNADRRQKLHIHDRIK